MGLVLLFAAAKPVLFDTLDPDCFWHLRVGEQLVREGVGPLRDHLSFSSQAEPWTPYSWLAEIGMYRLWSVGGLRAVIGVTSVVFAAIFAFVALICREAVAGALDDGPEDAIHRDRRPRPLATVLCTTFAAALSLPYLSFRPVTAVILLLALNTWLLLRDRRTGERSRAVWAIVPVTALGINLHLFAALTPMWCGALLVGAAWERLALLDKADVLDANRSLIRYGSLTLLTGLACLATPMLLGAWRAAVHYGWHDPMVASDYIAELRPFTSGLAGKLSLLLVVGLVTCLVRHHRRLRMGELLWLAFGFLLLLKFGRFAPMFALIAAPVLAVTMPALSDAVLARPPLRYATLIVLCLMGYRVVTSLPGRDATIETWVNRNGPQAPGYPVEAAKFVATSVPRQTGHILNEFDWGGYLEWQLGSRYQTLLDGRTQVFPPQFWQTIYLSDDTSRRQFFASTPADAAVLPAEKSVFKSSLVQLGWKVVHKDDRAEVLMPPQADYAVTE